MPTFYALVDAMTGREADVEAGLRAQPRILALARCKERNHDFLVRFDAPAFNAVDEFLQTHVRRIAGVAGVEIVVDWQNHGEVVREARKRIG